MEPLADTVDAHLKANSAVFTRCRRMNEERRIIFLAHVVLTHSIAWPFAIDVRERERLVLANSVPEIPWQQECAGSVMQLLTDINYELEVGSWELNRKTGWLQFKTYHMAWDSDFTDDDVRGLCTTNFGGVHHYLDTIRAVANGTLLAEDALSCCRKERGYLRFADFLVPESNSVH